jgi:hypothetical protein
MNSTTIDIGALFPPATTPPVELGEQTPVLILCIISLVLNFSVVLSYGRHILRKRKLTDT